MIRTSAILKRHGHWRTISAVSLTTTLAVTGAITASVLMVTGGGSHAAAPRDVAATGDPHDSYTDPFAGPNVALPKPTSLTPPVDDPHPPWPSGIFQDEEAPFPGQDFLGINRWQGTLNGTQYTVFAGRAGYDRRQTGEVIVMNYGDGTTDPRGHTIETPIAGGALSVVSADPSTGTVTMTDESGTTYVLNVVALVLTP